MSVIELRPIGIITTPFSEPKGTPIQPKRSGGAKGIVTLYPEYTEGLSDLDGFSHVILLYHFHLSSGYKLSVIPYLDTREHGLFATRAPGRPNPLGISTVQLSKISGNRLYVRGVDMIDGTPLLDIKPYVPEFDNVPDCRIGWLSKAAHAAKNQSADDRFHK